MAKTRAKTKIAFRLCLGAWGFIVLMILSMVAQAGSHEMLTGILAFAAGIIATVGLFFSLWSLKEPNSWKKILSLILNFLVSSLFIALLVAVLKDMSQLL